jgi:hypothetical protein
MVTPNKVFTCTRCDKVHNIAQDALDCCPTEIIEQFECQSCGTVFDTLEEATVCCGEDEIG